MKRRDLIKSLAACAGIGTVVPSTTKADDYLIDPDSWHFIEGSINNDEPIPCPIYIDSKGASENYSLNGKFYRVIPNVTLAFSMNEMNEKNYNHMQFMESSYVIAQTRRDLMAQELPYDWIDPHNSYNLYYNNRDVSTLSPHNSGNDFGLNWGIFLDNLKPNTLFIQNRHGWTFTPTTNIELDNALLNPLCINALRRMAVFVAPPEIILLPKKELSCLKESY